MADRPTRDQYVYWDHGTNSLANLTSAQLQAIYTSSTGQATIGSTIVKACLPVAGTAVRTNFLAAIGVDMMRRARAPADRPAGSD